MRIFLLMPLLLACAAEKTKSCAENDVLQECDADGSNCEVIKDCAADGMICHDMGADSHCMVTEVDDADSGEMEGM